MSLAELRKLAIRKQFKIRFPLRNGMECVITEHGLAQVPGLRGKADLNLEQELAAAAEFLLEPVVAAGGKQPPQLRSIGREELAALAASSSGAAARAGDREDE